MRRLGSRCRRHAVESRGPAALALLAALAAGGCTPEETLNFLGADPLTPRLELTPDELTLSVGGTAAPSATLAGRPISGADATWQSTDPSIAVVDASGNVTCVGVGAVTITASLPSSDSQNPIGDSIVVHCVEPSLVRLDADSLSHSHVVGESPCPDRVGEIEVTNESGVELTLEVASDNPALFADPGRVRLSPGASARVTIFFNCSVRSSFSATVSVTARDAGGRTQVETVRVDVAVG